MPYRRKRRKRWRRPKLVIAQILAWADDYNRETGRWPKRSSGPIAGELEETWCRVDNALILGLHSLPGGSSLAQLLARYRGVRNVRRLPILTEKVILRWAQQHHRRTGVWPHENSGPVHGAPGEVWKNIDAALRQGTRSLRAGSSLAKLLAGQLGARTRPGIPPLTVEQILARADAHQARTGQWPKPKSGPIADAPGETWAAVEAALRLGNRDLPGGSSLAELLVERRGVRNRAEPPKLTAEQILAWADAHHERTGEWPSCESGPIPDAPGETWGAIDQALSQGLRGFPGGSSLARLLAERRTVRNRAEPPALTAEQVLAWADAHHARTGRWPTARSGPVVDAPGETWLDIESALFQGHRDLPGGSSLAQLLAERRGTRNWMRLPKLTPEQIRAWAVAHRERTGQWPTAKSGPVLDALGETWKGIETMLTQGHRDWPGGSSIARLLKPLKEKPP